MDGEDFGPIGHPPPQEVVRSGQSSGPSQAFPTSSKWRLRPIYTIRALPKASSQQGSLLITSLDDGVNHAVCENLKKEKNQKRVKFQPYLAAQQAFAADPGASGKMVARRAKAKLNTDLQNRCLKHSVSLEHQGKLFCTVNANAASVWAKTTQSLPSAQMKFALNAASDTLPHNANLALWRKGDHLSAASKLCGKRQTLCHVLNNCKVALELDDMTVLADLNTREDGVKKKKKKKRERERERRENIRHEDRHYLRP